MRQARLVGLLAGGLLLLAAPRALAQATRMGSTGGGISGSSGSFTGGFGSSSSGSFTGGFGSSTAGSFSGGFGSSSGGGFTGGSSFGGSGSTFGGSSGFGGSGGVGGVGTGQVGTTSPFGRYFGNPLAAGISTSGTGVSSSQASKYYRAFPTPLSFATPIYGTQIYGTATVNRGTTGIGGTTGTLGATGSFAGASSAGIRRAPAYITEPVFDIPPRPRGEAVRADLQGVIDRSTRLPSRGSIRVLTDGEVVILRGEVRDQRERRLAEAIVRLTPGVRQVRNELKPRTLSPPRVAPKK
jgi:hypothetical protein